MGNIKKNLSNPNLYRQLNSPEEMFNYTMTNIMDNFYNSSLNNTTDGTFKAVCLSGIDSEDNTIILDEFVYVIVRPLTPFGEILPDPAKSTDPDEIRTLIDLHGSIFVARADFQEDGYGVQYGEILNCYFEKGNISNSDFSGLRFSKSSKKTMNSNYIPVSTELGEPQDGSPQGADWSQSQILGDYPESDPNSYNSEFSTISATDRALLNLIKSGEGSYNAANNLRADTSFQFSIGKTAWVNPSGVVTDSKRHTDQKKISDLTIAEIMELQSGKPGVRKLFAVGAYQIIPRTMISIVNDLKIDKNEVFTESLQDYLGLGLIYIKQNKFLGKYLLNKGQNSVELAQLGMAGEWASIPMANGKGYHEKPPSREHPKGFNKPAKHIKPAQVQKLLQQARNYNIQNNITEFQTLSQRTNSSDSTILDLIENQTSYSD